MHFKVADMDYFSLTQLTNLASHTYGIPCVPTKPLSLANVYLFITRFCEYSLVVPKFQIEKIEFHCSMPSFCCYACTYDSIGYKCWHGFLAILKLSIPWRGLTPHNQE